MIAGAVDDQGAIGGTTVLEEEVASLGGAPGTSGNALGGSRSTWIVGAAGGISIVVAGGVTEPTALVLGASATSDWLGVSGVAAGHNSRTAVTPATRLKTAEKAMTACRRDGCTPSESVTRASHEGDVEGAPTEGDGNGGLAGSLEAPAPLRASGGREPKVEGGAAFNGTSTAIGSIREPSLDWGPARSATARG